MSGMEVKGTSISQSYLISQGEELYNEISALKDAHGLSKKDAVKILLKSSEGGGALAKLEKKEQRAQKKADFFKEHGASGLAKMYQTKANRFNALQPMASTAFKTDDSAALSKQKLIAYQKSLGNQKNGMLMDGLSRIRNTIG